MNVMHRNFSLDSLKTLCCIFVILEHLWFVCTWAEDSIEPLISMSVPLFFMISGYCNQYETPAKKYWERWKRICKILFFSVLFYVGLYYCVDSWFNLSLLQLPSTKDDICRCILINDFHKIGRGHLWYLASYLYVLMFFALFKKINFTKYYLLLLLIVPNIITSISINDFHASNNFLLVGIPCYSIGMITNRYVNNENQTLKFFSGVIALFTSIMLSFGIHNSIASSVCQWIFAISLFCFIISVKQQHPNVLSKIGEQYTLYIYIFHMAVIDLFFSTNFSQRYFYHMSFLSPIIVFFITLCLSAGYRRYYNKIEKHFLQKSYKKL